MKVKEEIFKLRVPIDNTRSTGLHLSSVLRDLALRSGVLDQQYAEQGNLDENIILHVGLAVEDYLAKCQHPEICYHPGELHLDGIAMSPDGITLIDSEDLADKFQVELDTWVLSEFKVTRKSSRDFKESLRLRAKKVLLWLWQVQAYRYAMNKRCEAGLECYIARLHIFFLNGDYSREGPGGQPCYQIFQLEFTPEELESNWCMILSHANCMREEGRL